MAGRRKKKWLVAHWSNGKTYSVRICKGWQDRDEAVEELILNDVPVDEIEVMEIATIYKVANVKRSFEYEAVR
jgi:hypothetical protein